MNVSRETVFAALFDRFTPLLASSTPAGPIVTASRRFQQWSEVQAYLQPALFLRPMGQRATQTQAYGLTTWTLRASVWIYAQHSPDGSTIPSTAINALIDAVDAAMQPAAPGEPVTLGGLVEHAFIDGEILVDEGLLPNDTQMVAVIPITIITGS